MPAGGGGSAAPSASVGADMRSSPRSNASSASVNSLMVMAPEWSSSYRIASASISASPTPCRISFIALRNSVISSSPELSRSYFCIAFLMPSESLPPFACSFSSSRFCSQSSRSSETGGLPLSMTQR